MIQGGEGTNLLMRTICETLAMKQPAVRGSAGWKTGTMLLLKKPRYRLKHSATVLPRKVIALIGKCIGRSLRWSLPSCGWTYENSGFWR